MKRILLIVFVIVSANTVSGQCPPGASAFNGMWVRTLSMQPILIDTLCWVTVTNFPPNSKVYIYNTTPILWDSLVTDATGHGGINFLPGNCLTYYPVGASVGTAVCGTCTTNISFAALLAIKIRTYTVSTIDNKANVAWQLEDETPGVVYEVQESSNGTNFSTVYTVTNSTASTPGKQYQYQTPQTLSGKRFYRLKITEHGNHIEYSSIKTATPKGYSVMDVYPSIGSGNFTASLPDNFINGEIKIFTTSGSMVQASRIIAPVFKFTLNTGKGVYHIKAVAADGSTLVKTIMLQ